MRLKRFDREILAIALPAIVANITTPLLGLVDMAIVGHMGSAAFIAAIAVGGTVFSMLYWVLGFLRMGTSGLTAQAVGACDRNLRDSTLFRSLALAMAMGLVIIALRGVIKGWFVDFMTDDDAVSTLTRSYVGIVIFGAPPTLGLYALNGWFIGLQNSRLIMWNSFIINTVNITLSIILVYVFGMGIEGVATGTLVAQWTGFGTALAMGHRYHPVIARIKELFEWRAIKRFFSINTDIFLRTVCLTAVTVWFTRAGARQGDIILSVNALMMQLFTLFSYMMDGYANAGEAIAGRLVGSGQRTAKLAAVRRLFAHAIVISAIFTAAYGIAGDWFMGLLSDNANVSAATADYRWWVVTIPFAGFAAFVWDGIMIGETMTRQMLISMGIAMALFFGLWWGLSPRLGNHALWLAFITYLCARGIVQTILYRRAMLSQV